MLHYYGENWRELLDELYHVDEEERAEMIPELEAEGRAAVLPTEVTAESEADTPAEEVPVGEQIPAMRSGALPSRIAPSGAEDRSRGEAGAGMRSMLDPTTGTDDEEMVEDERFQREPSTVDEVVERRTIA